MTKKYFVLATLLVSAMEAGNACADTVYLPGSGATFDPLFAGTCVTQPDFGQIYTGGLGSCVMTFSIELPVGKIIDAIEVGYSYNGGGSNPFVSAILKSNQYKPLVGFSDLESSISNPLPGETLFKFPAFSHNIPVAKWTTYWVRVEAYGGGGMGTIFVDGISVAYH